MTLLRTRDYVQAQGKDFVPLELWVMLYGSHLFIALINRSLLLFSILSASITLRGERILANPHHKAQVVQYIKQSGCIISTLVV
jgi:hypothetical protein